MNWISHTHSYLSTAIIAYTAIQLSGLILIGIVVGLFCLSGSFLDASITVPLAIMIGAMMTCIPTAAYALVLPAVVWITQRKTKSVIAVFGVTSLLTTITLLAVTWLLNPETSKPTCINNRWSLAYLSCAYPPGWLGTYIVRKLLAQQIPGPYSKS